MPLNQRVRIFSAGDCSVCTTAGAAIFLVANGAPRIFFACPSCGCAWSTPPTALVVNTVDSPALFAPDGFRLATQRDIADAEMLHLVADDHAEQSTVSFDGNHGFVSGD